jgi:CDP-4-dehydro-6-deoxyglucose reductase
MRFLVSIKPGDLHFSVADGETILDAALQQGIMLPHGCRDGGCGACRGRVLSGSVDHGEASMRALPAADRDAGFALFCCAFAQSDLVIEVRVDTTLRNIPARTLPARVHKLTLAAPDVMLVELQLPASERLQYLAGQYIEILLSNGRRRYYSLASAPAVEGNANLQMHIRRVPGGRFTDQVFTTLREREVWRINGPHGSFFLREDAYSAARPALLIAGGAGFGPIKAIVEHAIASGSQRQFHLYWGGRHRADLYLAELAESWAAAHANISFVPVLSEPADSDSWDGRRGLVHLAALADLPDLSGWQAYVCGSPAMVAAAHQDLIEKGGLPATEFFADAFSFATDGATASPKS